MTRKVFIAYLTIVIFLCCNSRITFANNPVPIDSVDLSRIRHKKIRRLIELQKKHGIRTFDEINPVCYSQFDSAQYQTYIQSQIIKQNIDIVWQNLVQQSPTEEFDGRIVTFGLLYSKQDNQLIYRNEPTNGIEEGQVLFFNLRVLSGIKNLAVALEVTKLDPDSKTIEYCYMEHGDTKGTQKFILTASKEGYTEIKQITKYRCKSRFRDRRLYSFFHELIVNEFFYSIKTKCEHLAFVEKNA